MKFQRSRGTRNLLGVLTALVLLLGLLFAAPSSADAQTTTVFTVDFQEPATAACRSGTTESGTLTTSPAPAFNGTYCRLNGAVPLSTLAECLDAGATFAVDYGFSPSTGVCGFTGFAADPAIACEAPTVRINDLQLSNAGTPVAFDGCVFPLLIGAFIANMPPVAPTSFFASFAATTACIDSDTVQNDDAASGLGLGETFVGSDGNRFSITTGGPTCTFDGSDCNALLNLDQVDDVKTCLAGRAMAAAASEAEAATATEATAPVAIAISVGGGGELAHTGYGKATTVAGILGATLLGAGALMTGNTRRNRRD